MLRHKTRRASGDSVINKDKPQFSEPSVSDDDIDSLAGDAGESSDSNVSESEINGQVDFLRADGISVDTPLDDGYLVAQGFVNFSSIEDEAEEVEEAEDSVLDREVEHLLAIAELDAAHIDDEAEGGVVAREDAQQLEGDVELVIVVSDVDENCTEAHNTVTVVLHGSLSDHGYLGTTS